MTRAAAPDWLQAETLAWPLVSRAAFDRCILTLERTAPATTDGATGLLADALDRWLRPRASGWSLDALALLRDRCWFPDGGARVPLSEYVTALAAARLRVNSERIELYYSDARPYPEAVARWHWLSRVLPPDLLVAALIEEDEPASERVHLATPELDRLLQSPVAETHLHVGAAVPFPILWTGLMARIGDPATLPPRSKKLTRGALLPFASPEEFVSRLAAASAVRSVLAGYLQRREDTGDAAPLARAWRELARCVAGAAHWSAGESEFIRQLQRLLGTAVAPDQCIDVPTARALVRALPGGFRAGRDGQVGEAAIARIDPLSRWLSTSRGGALPETRFARRALTYLRWTRGNQQPDPDFAQLFWQYQRIRGLCFRHLVHEPGTEGLDWFSRHFRRISALREPVEAHKFAIALQSQRHGLNLRSLEVRTTPESSWEDNARLVEQMRRQTERAIAQTGELAASCPELALVLHFVKTPHCACGRPHGDPRHRASRGRYSAWLRDALVQVRALARLFRYRPEALELVRAVDVANLENSIPSWVTAPLIAEARAVSIQAADMLTSRAPERPVAPLRVTYHAGEDYPHLLSGMRRMHELLEAQVLRYGDRIGHGLAAGASVESFVRTRSRVPMRAEERLDDLLWEFERYGRDDLRPEPRRDSLTRDRAVQLARWIYADPELTIDTLAAARRLRHECAALRSLGYPENERAARPHARLGRLDRAHQVLHRYLYDVDVYRRGQRVLEVSTSVADIRPLMNLQVWLRAQLAGRAVTVESNPTSNLGIADMQDLREHPSFVMAPIDSVEGAVGLSINTDNPLTFSTCLADEYAYLYAALLARGVDQNVALDWLKGVRQTGWQSRFSLELNLD